MRHDDAMAGIEATLQALAGECQASDNGAECRRDFGMTSRRVAADA
jgi:hypothetical protein